MGPYEWDLANNHGNNRGMYDGIRNYTMDGWMEGGMVRCLFVPTTAWCRQTSLQKKQWRKTSENNLAALNKLGIITWQENRLAEAAAYFQQAIAAHPYAADP